MLTVPQGLPLPAPCVEPAFTLEPPQAATTSPARASSTAARARLVPYFVTRSSLVADPDGSGRSLLHGGPADAPGPLRDALEHDPDQHDGDAAGEAAAELRALREALDDDQTDPSTRLLRPAQTPGTMPSAIVNTARTSTEASVTIDICHSPSRTQPTRQTAAVMATRRPAATSAMTRMAATTSHHGELVRRFCSGSMNHRVQKSLIAFVTVNVFVSIKFVMVFTGVANGCTQHARKALT